MPKRRLKRYKMRQPDKIRLSRQLDDQLLRRQEQLSRQEEQEEPAETERPVTTMEAWSYVLRVGLFFLLLLIGAVAVWVSPHPTHSDVEKRDLAKFPVFSIKTFFSGDYFDGINTWFADTFPGREGWVKLDSWENQFYRMSDEKLYGRPNKADDIPDAPTRPTEEETTAAPTTTSKAGTTGTSASTTAPTTTAPTTSKTTRAIADRDYWQDNQPENAPTQTLDGVLVRGESAFEYYNFSQSTANEYVQAINRAASNLKGVAKVYDLVVPTSIDVMLPEAVRNKLNTSDQKKATEYLYGSMSASVVTVPVIDTLRAHNDEYLYFHSDHHWTARGAYYAYAAFAQKAGFKPHAIGEYTETVFDGFKGSFFSETQDAKLREDTVIAYEPIGGGDLFFVGSDGSELDWYIISDVSAWAASSKYNTFIGGDNPYTEITSGSVHDGSSIVVVKESFGNAFVPFLVDHYEKVYVLDYRYYSTMSLTEFVKANGVKDVLFINNMSATRNAGLVEDIDSLVG